MRRNRGVISLFALLSMLLFLIFIVVAYNNVSQKGKNQVEIQGVLKDTYNSNSTASQIINGKKGGNPSSMILFRNLRGLSQIKKANKGDGTTFENNNKFIYSNGRYYKIKNDFQLLEYIESTEEPNNLEAPATQYIDTGLTIDNTTIIEVDGYTYGTASLYGISGYMNCIGEGGYMCFDYYNNSRYTSNVACGDGQRHIIKQSENKVYIDGVIEKSFTSSQFTTENSNTTSEFKLYLFACNDNQYAINDGRSRIYSVKIWKNGSLVRDYVPCRKMEDGKVGLYDKLNNGFYPNLGNDSFTAGPGVQ